MRTHPNLRERIGLQPVAGVGGLRQIMAGLFGSGSPTPGIATSTPVQQSSSLYHFHEGDVFLPGTGNWVLDPAFDVPITTIWGNGFLTPANRFSVIQPPPIDYGLPFRVAGLGGTIPGQIIFAPLTANPNGGQ